MSEFLRKLKSGIEFFMSVLKAHWKVTLTCVIVIAFPLCVILMDRWHLLFEGILDFATGGHHFSGDTWFAAAVTLLAATPSFFLGIVALWQAQHIFELQNRYNRPVLSLHNADLTIFRISLPEDLNKLSEINGSLEQRKYFQELLLHGLDWAFETGICFDASNNITIRDLTLENMSIRIGDSDVYTIDCERILGKRSRLEQFRHLSRSYENDRVLYKFSWYWDAVPRQEESDPGECLKRIGKFVNYSTMMDYDCRQLELTADFDIDYEFRELRKEKKSRRGKQNLLQVHIIWKADKLVLTGEPRFTVSSGDGYFSYEG